MIEMEHEIFLEGHGVPFTLVRCPVKDLLGNSSSREDLAKEIVNSNLKKEDIEKKYPSVKVTVFDRSDKEFMFIVRSTYKLAKFEINNIKQILINDRADGIRFCLVIQDYFDIIRCPKTLAPFM